MQKMSMTQHIYSKDMEKIWKRYGKGMEKIWKRYGKERLHHMEFGEIIEGQQYQDREGVYGLLINEENLIAIIKTNIGFFLPGGGIENNEDHWACLKREMVEETGFGVDIDEYIGTSSFFGLTPNSKQYLKLIGNFYLVHLNGFKTKKIEEDHELIWMDLETAVKSLRLAHQGWAVEQVMNKL